MPSNLHRVVIVAAAAAIPLAACGDDDGGAEDLPEDAIVIDAQDSLRFSPDEVSAAAGAITFGLENVGSLQHTFVIEDHEDELKLTVSGSGDTDSGSIDLEAGDYVFYCDVPGHRGGGMEGTLTVE